MYYSVGDCIICLNQNVLQNCKYFFASDEILLVRFTMFLLFSLSIVPFSHKLTLHKKCPYSEIRSISQYLVQMRENTNQNNSEY